MNEPTTLEEKAKMAEMTVEAIKELEQHGSTPRSHKQILAIALSTALDRHKKKKK